MQALVTGAYGRCGTAIIDHLHDREEYDFTYLNRSDRPADHEYGGYDTFLADVAEYDAMAPAFEGKDAVVHLAGFPDVESSWGDVLGPNVVGMYNALEAARRHEVDTFVFGSTNHVVGEYELEHAPEIYYPGHGIELDHTVPVRPDSFYGASKSFGEDLGRFYVEEYDYPRQFYALRICAVRAEPYDHPYGDAERGADEGRWTRDSEEYATQAARMKAMWQSRRDFAHQIDRCLQDDRVTFDVFYGVSDNYRRWVDIEHARTVLGYRPRDDGEEWEGPPA